MGLFAKKELLYCGKGTKAEWKSLKAKLKEAGIRTYASTYEDEMPVCGCGAQMDVRDYGPNGRIDRSVYQIRVRAEELGQAQKVLHAFLPHYAAYEPK